MLDAGGAPREAQRCPIGGYRPTLLGDSDMMRIFGWRSRQMLLRYGASGADERAREAYKRLNPGARL